MLVSTSIEELQSKVGVAPLFVDSGKVVRKIIENEPPRDNNCDPVRNHHRAMDHVCGDIVYP